MTTKLRLLIPLAILAIVSLLSMHAQSPGFAVVAVPSGATPTLTTTAGFTTFNWTLSTNIASSTFSSVAVGAGALNLCEDSTGGYAVTLPANFVGFAPMASTAHDYCQRYTWFYDGTNVMATSNPSGVSSPTYTHSPTISYSGKTCPVYPDDNFWNTDVSSYPYNGWNSYYVGMWPNLTHAFTGASWSGGTATITVASTTGLTEGNGYPISGAVSSACAGGGDCGYNSHPASLGDTGSTYAVHIIDGTHFSYSLVSNPGTWTSGGLLYRSTPVQFHHVPEMYLNLADNSTAVLNPSNSVWGDAIATDAGPYPWTSSFLISTYHNTVSGGYVTPSVTTSTSYASEDRHVLSINMDTCQLYETYNSQSDSAPWANTNGAIFDLRSNDLRTAKKHFWYGNDSAGLTSADVAGLAIWAGTLTYAELYSGQPIRHAIRIGLPGGSGAYTDAPISMGLFVWPATHHGNNAIPLGIRWVLNASFDGTTCHFRDCAGLAWPDYMQRLIVALKTYGAVFTDTGSSFVGVSTDAVSDWGATDDPASPTWIFSGWVKTILWQDGHTVDPTIHVVSTTSGALR